MLETLSRMWLWQDGGNFKKWGQVAGNEVMGLQPYEWISVVSQACVWLAPLPILHHVVTQPGGSPSGHHYHIVWTTQPPYL
jgi:hypothetical protein